MNPDRAWVNLMQNNPLNGELLEQIRAVDGVEEVKVKTYLTGTLAESGPGAGDRLRQHPGPG